MKKEFNEKKHIRTFGFGLTVFLALIGGLQIYKGHSSVAVYPFSASLVALCVSLAFPIALKPIYKVMMFAAQAIGWVNTRLLLGIIFYTIFAPIGLFLRLIRKDLLDRKFDKNCDSYWVKRDKQVMDMSRYEKQF
ncbi:MAG: SxtJ family membrane protein [Candidatus Anammoxibacter sp.]